MEQHLGDRIDGLGCTTTLEDGDLIAGAVVLLKVVEPDGTVRLSMTWSEGMAWTERLGMLHAALASDTPSPCGEEG